MAASNTEIHLKDIYLSSSSFQRPKNYLGEGEDKLSISIKTAKDDLPNRQLMTTLSVKVALNKGEIKEEFAAIEMQAIFEYGEQFAIPLETFAHVNAAAIIYPFIREHLANLAMKANMNRILLPPFNFVAFHERNKSEEDNEQNLG